MRNREHLRIARIFGAIALEGAQIVRVTELTPQLFENLPITLRAIGTGCSSEPFQQGFGTFAVQGRIWSEMAVTSAAACGLALNRSATRLTPWRTVAWLRPRAAMWR